MLASITPLGERGRRRRWGVTAAWYAAGCLAGGGLLGALAALVSVLLGGRWHGGDLLLVSLALCVAGVVVDLGVGGLRPPGPHRQVNEDWLHRYRGWVIGLGFGVQLGLGVTTIVTTAAVYSALAVAALVSPMTALVAGISFGLGRALPLLAVRRAVDPTTLRRVVARAAGLARPVATGTVALQIAVCAGLCFGGLIHVLTGPSGGLL
jgi:MFS family permease